MKKRLVYITKILISVVLIWYLLRKINLPFIFQTIEEASLHWLIFSFVLNLLGRLISAIRWKYLLASQDIDIPLKVLVISLFVGHFFNNFLPSTVGGDAIRAYDSAKYSRRKIESMVTVITERIMGILALGTLAMGAVILNYFVFKKIYGFFWIIFEFFIAIAFLFFLITITSNHFVNFLLKLLNQLKLSKIGNKIKKVFIVYDLVQKKKNVLFITFIISLILQLNVVLHYYLISKAIDMKISMLYIFTIIPIVLVILLIPISINGIGVRENAYAFLMALIGIPKEKAVAFSWIAFGFTLLMGILGGIIFAFRKEIK